MIHGKVWGTTQPVFEKNGVSVHRLSISKGGYCSEHWHRHRINGFFCESGFVRVHAHRAETDLHDITTLRPGDFTTVQPGDKHYFEAAEPSVLYEIYWTECHTGDIVRDNGQARSKGGVKDAQTLLNQAHIRMVAPE